MLKVKIILNQSEIQNNPLYNGMDCQRIINGIDAISNYFFFIFPGKTNSKYTVTKESTLL